MAPRIRTIKPSYWSDAKVCSLSVESQLLYIGLWNFADCEGLLWDDPDQIRLSIFPSRPHIRVAALLEEILLTGLLVSVETTLGRNALWIPKFTTHQRIKNESSSEIAPFLARSSGQIRTGADTADNVPQEGKGREGKGEGHASRLTAVAPLVELYVSECEKRNYSPIENWRKQLVSQATRLLAEKPLDLIESAIRAIADEYKQPGVLAHVVADLESARGGNRGKTA